MTTRRNHYVPVWLSEGVWDYRSIAALLFGTLVPMSLSAPASGSSGSRRMERGSPKKFFWSRDLYTTLFFGAPNDEIERFLFRSDRQRRGSCRASGGRRRSASDPRVIFKTSSRISTRKRYARPRGWIGSEPDTESSTGRTHGRDAALRQMHCTMWLEAVREVVSADDSDVKFIVSDHPVTIYNPRCPPDAMQCRYPDEPPIELNRLSKTIFALSANHCLIFTNLEYAKDPAGVDLLRPRQNPRHFGTTLARTDAWIRTRKLSRAGVIAINHILKSRARRYIAAAEEEWLYPERAAAPTWSDIGKDSCTAAGKTSCGTSAARSSSGTPTGRSSYQDAFGSDVPRPRIPAQGFSSG